MASLSVSVIIPTYRGADFLGAAIQSVLKQTYDNFELIVVNDGSPDNTDTIIASFDDPRLSYIVHAQNLGARAARKTGILASSAEIVAFLDQDDTFHPEKLEHHISLLAKNPEIGATYNSRFELNYSSETIREIWQPPKKITLADLVLGFPIAPSDLVLRREWASKMIEIQGNVSYFHGGEILSYGRLYLSGCKFEMVDRALTFHRYHADRTMKNIEQNCQDYLSAQEGIFSDPRCPLEVSALKDQAYANSYIAWACYAFSQKESELGQQLVRFAVKYNPSVIRGKPGSIVKKFMHFSIADDNQDHAKLLEEMFDQLPAELEQLSQWTNWAIAQGYLWRGARAMLWNRPNDGRRYFSLAIEHKAKINHGFLQKLTHQLVNYEKECGVEATRSAIRELAPYMMEVGPRKSVRWLKSRYAINCAFREYHAGDYTKVPYDVVHAIVNDPSYLSNRGVLSILFRSIAYQMLDKFR